MILTTTQQIEGHAIREYKGVVTGETIIGANFVKDFFAGIRDIVGGRSSSYEKVLREAKDTSMKKMMERAQAMGANAIVGIDIDYETHRRNQLYADGSHQRNSGCHIIQSFIMTPQEERNQKLAERMNENLNRRNMEAFYCPTGKEAVEKVPMVQGTVL